MRSLDERRRRRGLSVAAARGCVGSAPPAGALHGPALCARPARSGPPADAPLPWPGLPAGGPAPGPAGGGAVWRRAAPLVATSRRAAVRSRRIAATGRDPAAGEGVGRLGVAAAGGAGGRLGGAAGGAVGRLGVAAAGGAGGRLGGRPPSVLVGQVRGGPLRAGRLAGLPSRGGVRRVVVFRGRPFRAFREGVAVGQALGRAR